MHLVGMLCFLLVALVIPDYVLPQSTSVEVSFLDPFTGSSVVGGFTEITCTFSTITAGQSVASVSWRHNFTQAVTSGVSTDIAAGTSVLEINNVEESDAGEYTCRVNFQNPSVQNSGSALLRVASELVVEAEAEQSAIEGDNATLLCNVTSFPDPRIRWFRVEESGTEVLLLDQDSGDSDFGEYEILTIDRSDAGTYRCTGQYIFGAESADIELVVLTVPVISTTQQHVVIVNTDTLQLNCSAEGVREPTYRWLFGGEEVIDGGRVELDSENGELVIGSLSFNDTGDYTCVAETEAGTDNITHTVTVSGAPEIQLPDDLIDVFVAAKSVAEISCPFLSHPLPEVKWSRTGLDGITEDISSMTDGFTIIMANGSLLISNVSQAQASRYECQLSNEFGSDNRTFILRVIELPNKPEGFTITLRGDQSVGLVWQAPASSPLQPVTEYVLQLGYVERRGVVNSSRVIPYDLEMYTAGDLVPGVSYSLVLRSSNLAGLSPPTPPLFHTTASAPPRLEFFFAESLGDGRSVLLQWRLEYSGGFEVETFLIEVLVDDVVVETLRPDVYNEALLLDDLRPSTDYLFQAVVGNALGMADPLMSNASTPIAAPSQPTQPALEDRSLQVLTISFSVKFGSAPIDYYLLRIFDSSDLTDTTDTTNATLVQDLVYREVNISSGDVGYVKSEEGIVEGGKVVGYEVTMRVRGLQQGRRYVFSVAAGSEIGEGDYSDLSDPFSLEDELILYLIVGGVVAGVVLVVIVLLVVSLLCFLVHRRHRGGKVAITRRGSDSTGVATDCNLRFEPCNGTSYPRPTSPNLSQRVDSAPPTPHPTSPPPTSPRITSPHLTTKHYYNSLRKYQSDTLPLNGVETTDGSRGNGVNGQVVAEVRMHSDLHINGEVSGKGSLVDSGHYSRPTVHPTSHPSGSSTLPPFLPQSSTSSSTQHPSYNHLTSHPLYSTPRKGNPSHTAQVSISSLPAMEEVKHVVVGSGSMTLPTSYTPMQSEVRGYHSMTQQNSTSTPVISNSYDSEISNPQHASFQTDV